MAALICFFQVSPPFINSFPATKDSINLFTKDKQEVMGLDEQRQQLKLLVSNQMACRDGCKYCNYWVHKTAPNSPAHFFLAECIKFFNNCEMFVAQDGSGRG